MLGPLSAILRNTWAVCVWRNPPLMPEEIAEIAPCMDLMFDEYSADSSCSTNSAAHGVNVAQKDLPATIELIGLIIGNKCCLFRFIKDNTVLLSYPILLDISIGDFHL